MPVNIFDYSLYYYLWNLSCIDDSSVAGSMSVGYSPFVPNYKDKLSVDQATWKL